MTLEEAKKKLSEVLEDNVTWFIDNEHVHYGHPCEGQNAERWRVSVFYKNNEFCVGATRDLLEDAVDAALHERIKAMAP